MAASILGWNAAALAGAGIYLLCGALRLARFNASPRNDRHFEGLPIPAAGIIFSASLLLDQVIVTTVLLPSLSILMISSIPYPKLHDWRSALLMALAILLAGGMAWQQNSLGYSLTYFLATTIYLCSPLLIAWPRLRR
jgi:phosphatidylserine synthase